MLFFSIAGTAKLKEGNREKSRCNNIFKIYLTKLNTNSISFYRTMEGDTTQLGAKLKDAGAI